MTNPNHYPPSQPPPIQPAIAYGAPGQMRPPVPVGRIILLFFAGLLLGTGVSAIIWIAGWKHVMAHSNGGVILVVTGVKFAIGVVLLFIRGWRSFGAGIIASIALGVMLFFGAWAASGTMH